MPLYGLVWLVALACWTHACGQRRLNDDAYEPTRCKDQPGYADGQYIVGRRAYDAYAVNNATDNVVEGWNTNDSEAEVLTLKKDCPVKYKLHYGDTVALIFTKMEHYGTIGFDFTQKHQEGSSRLPSVRFFFAWDKFVDYYRRHLCGEIGVNCWDSWYVPWECKVTGSFSWRADQWVQDLQDIRRDFYHQKNRTAGRVYHYNWRRRRNGRTFLFPSYGTEQHYGEEDGKLRIVLSTVEEDQMTDMGEDTVFEGQLEFHEWGGTGDIREEQYEAVKELYKTTCAPRRNGTPWNEPWYEPFSGWPFRHQYGDRSDLVPYCTWLQGGWNESYWDRHIDHQGGTCHMIPGVRCDAHANVIYLSLGYSGMKGAISALKHLTEIASFYVSFNQLSGTVPPLFSTSTKILGFNIWHNFFSGSVPCLGGDHISSMDISYNGFDGSLPDCYSDNPKWRVLNMEHNYIQGTYPNSWKTLTTVSTMWLNDNELSGSLPDEICSLNGVRSLNIEANRLEGQLPDKCLWSKIIKGLTSDGGAYYVINEADGWVEMSSLTAAHNRFSGPLPRINGEKDPRAVQYVTYDFDNNLFTGTIADQWEGLLNVSRGVTLLFRNNRLSGPLPSQMELWSKTYFRQRVRYDFEDNFFRCEPDGRWPDWVHWVRVEFGSAATASQQLGKCLPVAHPVSVSPAKVSEGQAAVLHVSGSDFVLRSSQICRFTHQETQESKDSPAVRIRDDLIRCQAPVTLAPGKYEVTVSNFGADFASKVLLENLQRLPTFEVVPARRAVIKVNLSDANAVELKATTATTSTTPLPGASVADGNVAKAQWTLALDAIAAVSLFVACFLCGFIQFLFTMEKKGQPFFKESLPVSNIPSKASSCNREPLLDYALMTDNHDDGIVRC